MTRAVYIGGFLGLGANAERVGEAISDVFNFDEIDVFTFAQANNDPTTVRKATHNIPVFTHSAGMLAIDGANPAELHSFSPPLPASRMQLLIRSVIKNARLVTPGIAVHSMDDLRTAVQLSRSSGKELVRHPVDNLSAYFNGQISRFNAVAASIRAQNANIPTTLAYMDNDVYFHLDVHRQAVAERAGVTVVRMAGEHDELALRPDLTLQSYAAIIDAV